MSPDGSRRDWRKPPSRLGYRGAFLLFLALLEGVVSWSLWHVPGSRENLVLPWQVWAIWWAASGSIAAVQAFMRRDAISFTSSALLFLGWGMVSVREWFDHVPYAWLGLVIWWCFAALIVVVSGWPEPVEVVSPGLPPIPPELGVGGDEP